MIRALVIASALVACGGGGKKATTEPATTEPATAESQPSESPPALANREPAPIAKPATVDDSPLGVMERFKDDMCGCKDGECAEDVSDRMTQWSKDYAQKHPTPEKKLMSEAEVKRATEIGTQMAECMQKAMGMGGANP